MGLLDRYKVLIEGRGDTLNMHINMYDEGGLKILVGMSAKPK